MTGNPRNAMVCYTPHLQNKFGDPQFFITFFNLILSISTCSQSFKKSACGKFLGVNVLNRIYMQISSPYCAVEIPQCFKHYNSHSMEYKSMLFVMNHMPYLRGHLSSFSKSFIGFNSCNDCCFI